MKQNAKYLNFLHELHIEVVFLQTVYTSFYFSNVATRKY